MADTRTISDEETTLDQLTEKATAAASDLLLTRDAANEDYKIKAETLAEYIASGSIAAGEKKAVNGATLKTALDGKQAAGNYQPAGDYVTETSLETTLNDYETTEHAGETYQPKGDYVTTKSGIFERIDTDKEGGQIEFQRANTTKVNIAVDVYEDKFRVFSGEGVGFSLDFDTKELISFGNQIYKIKTLEDTTSRQYTQWENKRVDFDLTSLGFTEIISISLHFRNHAGQMVGDVENWTNTSATAFISSIVPAGSTCELIQLVVIGK